MSKLDLTFNSSSNKLKFGISFFIGFIFLNSFILLVDIFLLLYDFEEIFGLLSYFH